MERHSCTPEQREKLLTLKEIAAMLGKFGLEDVPDHVVRRRLDAFFAEPTCWGPGRGESPRGTLPYYDPLIVWVLATALLSEKRAAARLRRAFADAHKTFTVIGADADAGLRSAYYAFISNPAIGIEVPTLDTIVSKHPDVLELTSDGREVLEFVLRVYKAQRIEDMTGQRVDVNDVVLGEKPKKSGDRHFGELVKLLQVQGMVDKALDPNEHRPLYGNARVHLGWME